MFLRHTTNGTPTDSPGPSLPSEKSSAAGTGNLAPTPAGCPSAVCSKFSPVNTATSLARFESDVSLTFVSLALKLNLPANCVGHPFMSEELTKVDAKGSNVIRELTI